MIETTNNHIKNTALYNTHKTNDAKIIEFAGYKMPLYYHSLGATKEHLHVREKAGIFDISHMGQLFFKAEEQTISILERLIPADLSNLPIGKQVYSLLLNAAGKIIDDLIIGRYDDFFLLIINAACVKKDIDFFANYLANDDFYVLQDRSLIALQGPDSEKILSAIIPYITIMDFMDCKTVKLYNQDCFVSRCGYTGEDGFEISVPNTIITKVAVQISEHPDVIWCGLSARDSLRLEAGLCLYGNDITENSTPASCSLNWTISKNRRLNGNNPGGFHGDKIILNPNQTPQTIRVGLIGSNRIPVRQGCIVVDANDQEIGIITSGVFSPSMQVPIAMANINTAVAKSDENIFVKVRKHKIKMQICKMPFVRKKYQKA